MIDFDPEQYRACMEESRRRFEIARRFEEPDRLPITISVAGSFFCKLFSINLRDYYQDAWGNLDTQLEVQRQGLKWVFEKLQDDRTGCGISVDIGPIAEALVFDLPVEYPDDTSPWIVRTRSLSEAVESLKLIPPEENPRVLAVYRQYERLKEKVERLHLKVGVGGGLGIHPPLSASCDILDVEEVMMTLQDDPPLIHRLFEKMLRAFLMLQEFHDRYFGRPTRSIGLCDDHSAFISDEMYRLHVMPYNMIIYARYGLVGRHLHADGPNDHHFDTYVDIVRLTSMDIGAFPTSPTPNAPLRAKSFSAGG